MGNSNGKTNTKRIGLAVADDLNDEWKRMDQPLLETGETNSWDDHCTTNPSVIQPPNGEYWMYYKSWNTFEYENPEPEKIRGNRKYGLAISKSPEGPFVKFENNPVIDFSTRGNNQQLEDAFIWHENNAFKMLARDMGFYNHEVGLYLESKNGINWDKPEIAFHPLSHYTKEPPAPSHLKRYGRLERPQILFIENKPAYLFTAAQGGKYNTASGFLLKIG